MLVFTIGQMTAPACIEQLARRLAGDTYSLTECLQGQTSVSFPIWIYLIHLNRLPCVLAESWCAVQPCTSRRLSTASGSYLFVVVAISFDPEAFYKIFGI